MSRSPLERLRDRTSLIGAPLCVGIDPRPDALPEDLPRDLRGVETFARGLIAVASEHAVAVKLNAAFFEALGSEGWSLLERLRGAVPEDLLFVLDAKRGDIASSAERYAEAIFGRIGADAVTVSPYPGDDAIEPFVAHDRRIVYVLARTSNPSAGRLQDLQVGAEPLYLHVARWVAERWPDGRVGLVVGATTPGDLLRTRAVAPGPAFLVPGVGAQGGDLRTAARACNGAWAPGLVAVSRGIAGASIGADWREAAAAAAGLLRTALKEAVLHSTMSAADTM
jgi:orotidine 5'-phosphate decarboxylase subfamily 2